MIFLKSLLGGVVAVALAWLVIVGVYMAHSNRNRGSTGLTAVANGWEHLLHLPLVVILLMVAFGVGLWTVSRW